MPKTARRQDPREKNRSLNIDFTNQPIMARAVRSIRDGWNHPGCNEIFIFGTRGDGKTLGWAIGTIEHAIEHHNRGFPLPVHWMGVTDTFTSHKLKTVRSLQNPIFASGWKFTDGDHKATFYHDHFPLVEVDLFGIEDQSAMDRVRMETHCVWFEEAAPTAVLVTSSGVGEDAWLMAITSQRMPTHYKAAVATLNYPDSDHWTWRRAGPTEEPVFANPAQFDDILKAAGLERPREFIEYPQGTPYANCMGVRDNVRYFRIPAGERASHEERMKWAESLKGRPDLLRRLILGQPGTVMLGQQVAAGFREDRHVTRETIPLIPGEPLYFGFDFGHTPTCIIAQPIMHKGYKTLVVKAALYLMNQGMKQLMDEQVLPWLSRYAKWVTRDTSTYALIGYDPSGEKGEEADITNSALQAIQTGFGGGDFEPGPTIWEPRREALVEALKRYDGVLIERNAFTLDLIRALSGRWFTAMSHQGELKSDKPKKPNHPWEDLGDAFIYCLIRYGMVSANEGNTDNVKILSNTSAA